MLLQERPFVRVGELMLHWRVERALTENIARALSDYRNERDALQRRLDAAMRVVEAARDLLDELMTTGDIPSAEKQDEFVVALADLDETGK